MTALHSLAQHRRVRPCASTPSWDATPGLQHTLVADERFNTLKYTIARHGGGKGLVGTEGGLGWSEFDFGWSFPGLALPTPSQLVVAPTAGSSETPERAPLQAGFRRARMHQ